MKRIHLPKFLDYIPPIIAFAAAVVAIVGTPKWDGTAVGIAKITPLGWLVLGIGLMALMATVLITARNSREHAQQWQTRERILATGKAQLLRAVLHTIHPLSSSFIWRNQCDAPESPADFLHPSRRETLAALELTSVSPYKDGSFEDIKWHQMLERAATEGASRIVTTLQIFSTYFPAEIIETATQFLNCEFLQMRLLRINDLVNANTHFNKARPVPFFMVKEDEMHNQSYEEFWMLTASAMTLCGAEVSKGQPLFGRP
ncbi:hypothetical protein [Dyella tabacisoli]|uniref:Uncharacterized protein n=1 Tax=Dyella tabacisoli TaxID=2282381 RepID=A0A369UQJ9_9GAMM|nr:hypothetical protein [Dyella tabacisoli]RDD81900.1 hypothetical protein DVJ77_08885 [Dyella tabacisoli]